MKHKGEIFEPGKLYKFKDFETVEWMVGKLDKITDDLFFCTYGSPMGPFDMIAEISANELGNIVQKPVELIVGQCYAFDSRGQRHNGFYSKAANAMVTVFGAFNVKDCSNFVELGEHGNV